MKIFNREIRKRRERKMKMENSVFSAPCSRISRGSRFIHHSGFTLMELLLVVAIIGILATVAMPHLAGFGKSNSMTAATRQLLDDVALARQKAMATRSTVYMVFIKDSYLSDGAPTKNSARLADPSVPASVRQQANDLTVGGQLTAYALMSLRSVGDQPGRAQWHRTYLTSWKTLPTGVFISQLNFDPSTAQAYSKIILPDKSQPIENYTLNFDDFPFPSIMDKQLSFYLPYIAFGPNGQLRYPQVGGSPVDEYLFLSHGSVMSFTNNLLMPPSIVETPRGNAISNYNIIHIDAITGRAKLERQEIH